MLWVESLAAASKLEGMAAGKFKSARRYRKHGGYYAERAERYEQEGHELRIEAQRIAAEAQAPFVAEWKRRGGWTRYHLVSGGHLHRSGCSTITPGYTLIGLLPAASGMTAAEVVETFQYTACTHCFPEAPVAHKPTVEELGLCEHSGQFVESVEGARVREQWWTYAVAPAAKCPCGYRGAITKAGKFRKHKAGG